jgi:hypothetical protein
LLDSSFPEGIQSLNLKDPQMLEKAVHFVKNPTEDSIKFLCARAQQLSKDFDRYKTSSKKNEYTDMWLRMAIMICRTVEDRLATHPEDLRGSAQVTTKQHYRIVTVLLLEVLADWNSPPDSFLRSRYLSDIDGDNEGSGTEEQTGGNTAHAGPRNETADEATGDGDRGPSMLGCGDDATADHPNVSTHSKNHGQQIGQKDPHATETG